MVFVLGILTLTGVIVYASYVQVSDIDHDTRKEIVKSVMNEYWEKYEELNARLSEVLEEQEKNPTLSGYETIYCMCKEIEILNKIHKKKVELLDDFEDEDKDSIIETMLSAYQDTLDEVKKKAKDKMSFEWIEKDKDGFLKVCNNFKVPEIPEFKPYIP